MRERERDTYIESMRVRMRVCFWVRILLLRIYGDNKNKIVYNSSNSNNHDNKQQLDLRFAIKGKSKNKNNNKIP